MARDVLVALLSGMWSTASGVLVALAFPAPARTTVCLVVAASVAAAIGLFLAGRASSESRSPLTPTPAVHRTPAEGTTQHECGSASRAAPAAWPNSFPEGSGWSTVEHNRRERLVTIAPESPTTTSPAIPSFLELEITRRCQLTCTSHCYAQAGPTQGHGDMTAKDWKRVISEAAALGVKKIQLIGGEPTLHPDFTGLVEHALAEGLKVQVYSNLYRVRHEHWALFARPGITLATSYYADTEHGHDQVTGRKGSHAATRANLLEAHRRGIRVRVGIVDVLDGQRVEEARTELQELGITQVHIDRVRGVGNAARSAGLPSTSELCGRCATGIAAVLSDGTVAPCVLGRFLPAGQITDTPLKQVFASAQWRQIAASIPTRSGDPCAPDCGPNDDTCKGGGTCDPADDSAIPHPAG